MYAYQSLSKSAVKIFPLKPLIRQLIKKLLHCSELESNVYGSCHTRFLLKTQKLLVSKCIVFHCLSLIHE